MEIGFYRGADSISSIDYIRFLTIMSAVFSEVHQFCMWIRIVVCSTSGISEVDVQF